MPGASTGSCSGHDWRSLMSALAVLLMLFTMRTAYTFRPVRTRLPGHPAGHPAGTSGGDIRDRHFRRTSGTGTSGEGGARTSGTGEDIRDRHFPGGTGHPGQAPLCSGKYRHSDWLLSGRSRGRDVVLLRRMPTTTPQARDLVRDLLPLRPSASVSDHPCGRDHGSRCWRRSTAQV